MRCWAISADPTDRWPRAWLIVSEPKAENRQWWKDHLQPARIVMLESMPDVCKARVLFDPDRSQASTFEAITNWWMNYRRRPGEEIVRIN